MLNEKKTTARATAIITAQTDILGLMDIFASVLNWNENESGKGSNKHPHHICHRKPTKKPKSLRDREKKK